MNRYIIYFSCLFSSTLIGAQEIVVEDRHSKKLVQLYRENLVRSKRTLMTATNKRSQLTKRKTIVLQENYNKHGLREKTVRYFKGGQTTFLYKYDSLDRETETEILDSKGAYDGRSTVEYLGDTDEIRRYYNQNELVAIEEMLFRNEFELKLDKSIDGKVRYRTEIRTDSVGKMTVSRRYNSIDYLERSVETQFDTDWNQVRRIIEDNRDKRSYKEIYRYNEAGFEIFKERKDSWDNLLRREVTECFESGLPKIKKIFNSDGELEKIMEYQYIFYN